MLHNKIYRPALLKGRTPFTHSKPISMKKSAMYYDTHRTRICKDIYKPTTGITHFIRSIWAVLMIGHSPISNTTFAKKRLHQR